LLNHHVQGRNYATKSHVTQVKTETSQLWSHLDDTNWWFLWWESTRNLFG